MADMKDPNSNPDNKPLNPLDILRCVLDAGNLINLSWLLYDKKRSARWFADLEPSHTDQTSQASTSTLDPTLTPTLDPGMDDVNEPVLTKRPPHAVPVVRIGEKEFNDRRNKVRRQSVVEVPLDYFTHDNRRSVGRRATDGASIRS